MLRASNSGDTLSSVHSSEEDKEAFFQKEQMLSTQPIPSKPVLPGIEASRRRNNSTTSTDSRNSSSIDITSNFTDSLPPIMLTNTTSTTFPPTANNNNQNRQRSQNRRLVSEEESDENTLLSSVPGSPDSSVWEKINESLEEQEPDVFLRDDPAWMSTRPKISPSPPKLLSATLPDANIPYFSRIKKTSPTNERVLDFNRLLKEAEINLEPLPKPSIQEKPDDDDEESEKEKEMDKDQSDSDQPQSSTTTATTLPRTERRSFATLKHAWSEETLQRKQLEDDLPLQPRRQAFPSSKSRETVIDLDDSMNEETETDSDIGEDRMRSKYDSHTFRQNKDDANVNADDDDDIFFEGGSDSKPTRSVGVSTFNSRASLKLSYPSPMPLSAKSKSIVETDIVTEDVQDIEIDDDSEERRPLLDEYDEYDDDGDSNAAVDRIVTSRSAAEIPDWDMSASSTTTSSSSSASKSTPEQYLSSTKCTPWALEESTFATRRGNASQPSMSRSSSSTSVHSQINHSLFSNNSKINQLSTTSSSSTIIPPSFAKTALSLSNSSSSSSSSFSSSFPNYPISHSASALFDQDLLPRDFRHFGAADEMKLLISKITLEKRREEIRKNVEEARQKKLEEEEMKKLNGDVSVTTTATTTAAETGKKQGKEVVAKKKSENVVVPDQADSIATGTTTTTTATSTTTTKSNKRSSKSKKGKKTKKKKRLVKTPSASASTSSKKVRREFAIGEIESDSESSEGEYSEEDGEEVVDDVSSVGSGGEERERREVQDQVQVQSQQKQSQKQQQQEKVQSSASSTTTTATATKLAIAIASENVSLDQQPIMTSKTKSKVEVKKQKTVESTSPVRKPSPSTTSVTAAPAPTPAELIEKVKKSVRIVTSPRVNKKPESTVQEPVAVEKKETKANMDEVLVLVASPYVPVALYGLLLEELSVNCGYDIVGLSKQMLRNDPSQNRPIAFRWFIENNHLDKLPHRSLRFTQNPIRSSYPGCNKACLCIQAYPTAESPSFEIVTDRLTNLVHHHFTPRSRENFPLSVEYRKILAMYTSANLFWAKPIARPRSNPRIPLAVRGISDFGTGAYKVRYNVETPFYTNPECSQVVVVTVRSSIALPVLRLLTEPPCLLLTPTPTTGEEQSPSSSPTKSSPTPPSNPPPRPQCELLGLKRVTKLTTQQTQELLPYPVGHKLYGELMETISRDEKGDGWMVFAVRRLDGFKVVHEAIESYCKDTPLVNSSDILVSPNAESTFRQLTAFFNESELAGDGSTWSDFEYHPADRFWQSPFKTLPLPPTFHRSLLLLKPSWAPRLGMLLQRLGLEGFVIVKLGMMLLTSKLFTELVNIEDADMNSMVFTLVLERENCIKKLYDLVVSLRLEMGISPMEHVNSASHADFRGDIFVSRTLSSANRQLDRLFGCISKNNNPFAFEVTTEVFGDGFVNIVYPVPCEYQPDPQRRILFASSSRPTTPQMNVASVRPSATILLFKPLMADVCDNLVSWGTVLETSSQLLGTVKRGAVHTSGMCEFADKTAIIGARMLNSYCFETLGTQCLDAEVLEEFKSAKGPVLAVAFERPDTFDALSVAIAKLPKHLSNYVYQPSSSSNVAALFSALFFDLASFKFKFA